jgi:hypothetical protein
MFFEQWDNRGMTNERILYMLFSFFASWLSYLGLLEENEFNDLNVGRSISGLPFIL